MNGYSCSIIKNKLNNIVDTSYTTVKIDALKVTELNITNPGLCITLIIKDCNKKNPVKIGKVIKFHSDVKNLRGVIVCSKKKHVAIDPNDMGDGPYKYIRLNEINCSYFNTYDEVVDFIIEVFGLPIKDDDTMGFTPNSKSKTEKDDDKPKKITTAAKIKQTNIEEYDERDGILPYEGFKLSVGNMELAIDGESLDIKVTDSNGEIIDNMKFPQNIESITNMINILNILKSMYK